MPIVLTQGQERQLEAMARSRSLPHSQVVRARIVLMAAKGITNTKIALKWDCRLGWLVFGDDVSSLKEWRVFEMNPDPDDHGP